MASRSAREIGFAASAGVDVPADADGPDDVPEDGAAPGACLEPKMADTMLPKTLMFSSCQSLPLNSSQAASSILTDIATVDEWSQRVRLPFKTSLIMLRLHARSSSQAVVVDDHYAAFIAAGRGELVIKGQA